MQDLSNWLKQPPNISQSWAVSEKKKEKELHINDNIPSLFRKPKKMSVTFTKFCLLWLLFWSEKSVNYVVEYISAIDFFRDATEKTAKSSSRHLSISTEFLFCLIDIKCRVDHDWIMFFLHLIRLSFCTNIINSVQLLLGTCTLI